MKKIITLVAALLFSSGVAYSGQLTYQPINPNFGGNPFNANTLMSEANAINKFRDPDRRIRKEQTALEKFNSTLQRFVISRIASSITSQVVDANNVLQPGTIETQDFIIDIANGTNGLLTLTTTDKSTGQSTVFELDASALAPAP